MLLGKLYRAMLAWKDMRCLEADKPLQSPAFPSSFPAGCLRPPPAGTVTLVKHIFFSSCALFTVCLTLWGSATALAVVSSDQLMSATSRGFASIDDIHTLSDHWRQSQMGQLVQDEAMQPFIEDLKRQLERKISGVRDKLGLELADLKDVAGGEIGLALVERLNDRAAVALTVDITDHHSQMEKLLVKIDRELTKRGATKSTEKSSGTSLTIYDFPAAKKEADTARHQAIFFVKDDMLCASDNRLEAEEMLRRFDGSSGDRLSDAKAYQATMDRCVKEANGLQPEVRWYVDPFGYARAVRSLAPADGKRRGKDYLKILSSQGFQAIQGIGGFVNLSVYGSFELLHRTTIYAPPIPGEPDKYRLAMRMMKFPNSNEMQSQSWVPRKLASYRTFNCDLKQAFEHFGSLFDAIAGYEEAFDGVLEGLERDPYGPQVDVRRDFIDHLGQRVTLVTDYKVPITPKCERFLFAIQVINPQAIAATVEKFMESDPNAYRTQFQGIELWEIQEAQDEVYELDIDSTELDLFAPVDDEGEKKNQPNQELSSSAVCVTNGHLFIASHVNFLKEVLAPRRQDNTLSSSGDYHEVEAAMAQLAPGAASAKFFLRTDEAYRPIYELLRQGKMPESETLVGRILNRLLAPAEEEDEGVLRQQKIDGRKLPEFEMVRRYFGPAGTTIRSQENGWTIVGATLSKQATQARTGGNAAADQSAIR